MKKLITIVCALLLITMIGITHADEGQAGGTVVETVTGKIDTGDTAWVLLSSALVMLMTPGLALFYGGMVRVKNVLGTVMQSFVIVALISVQWVLWGYTLSFGPDRWGVIGGLEWFGLKGVGFTPNSDYAPSIPHLAFMIFQAMFAVITPALITGAFAERMRFSSFLIFSLLWSTFVYDPIAHWVWGVGGWIRDLGALDFAGGTVVHISSGFSALAAALIIGKRKGYGREIFAPHNLPLTVLGAALLWFGWFGFNAGSAVSAGGLAVSAFVVTNTAAAAAALSWLSVEWIHRGKPTILGFVSGAVAGLVAITPASGFAGPLSSIIIGIGAGIFCYIAVSITKPLLGYDDSLDAFGIHGIGGTWGAIATGLFATRAINPSGNDGLFFGNPSLLYAQIVAVIATLLYAFIATSVILLFLKVIIGLRISEEDEVTGMDLILHGERAYNLAIGETGTGFLAGAKGAKPVKEEKKVSIPLAESLSRRIPPKTQHEIKESLHGFIMGGPKDKDVALPQGVFIIEIDGVDKKELLSWWRELCQMDWRNAPQAFKEIYGCVSRFKEGVMTFTAGDPEEFRKKIEELLLSSGFHEFEVRVIRYSGI